MGWDRDTPWRQGHLLSQDAFEQVYPDAVSRRGFSTAIIISHDCDLANEIGLEPKIEIIPAKILAVPDGNLLHSKNARRLQLELQRTAGPSYFELNATDKICISKKSLAKTIPDKMEIIDGAVKTLRQWLSDRYARSSYSNEFNDVLKRNKFSINLIGKIKPFGKAIDAVYFGVDDERNGKSADDNSLFELTIFLQYSLDKETDGLKIATEASLKIKELFQKEYRDETSKRWNDIQLMNCFPISDEAMSIADSKKLRKFDLEYLSLRTAT